MKLKWGMGALVALGVCGAMVAGCCMPGAVSDKIGEQVGKSVESGVKKSIEKSTNTQIETGDTAEAKGEDLKSVPAYPGAKRTFYVKGEPIDGKISISITYETGDSLSKVSAWYKDKMAGLGWTVSMTIAGSDGGEMVTYQKDNNATTATVNVAKSNDKTGITIMYNGAESGA